MDLWGVLLDSARMTPAYRARIASLLAARYGGDPETWIRAHDLASAWYAEHMDRPETWERGTWLEVVDSAEAEHLARLFREVGVAPPPDPLGTVRSLEHEAMSSIDAAFPDARPAAARLKRSGHRVFVATNATESNARGALAGASLLGAVDGVFTGERLATGKAHAARRAPRAPGRRGRPTRLPGGGVLRWDRGAPPRPERCAPSGGDACVRPGHATELGGSTALARGSRGIDASLNREETTPDGAPCRGPYLYLGVCRPRAEGRLTAGCARASRTARRPRPRRRGSASSRHGRAGRRG